MELVVVASTNIRCFKAGLMEIIKKILRMHVIIRLTVGIVQELPIDGKEIASI